MASGGMIGGMGDLSGELSGVGTVNAPAAPSYANSVGQTLNVQGQNAGTLLGLQGEYDPEEAALTANTFNSTLTSPAGLVSTLSDITPTIQNLSDVMNTGARTSAVNDYSNLAPAVSTAYAGANPGEAALLGNIIGTANTNLSAGSTLTPAMITQLDQSVRGGQAARGLGTGPGDAGEEAYVQAMAGQQLLGQREAAANSAATTYAGVMPSTLGQIIGTTSSVAPATPAGLFSAGSAITGTGTANLPLSMDDPEFLSEELAAYGGQLQANTSTASNNVNLLSAGGNDVASGGGKGGLSASSSAAG